MKKLPAVAVAAGGAAIACSLFWLVPHSATLPPASPAVDFGALDAATNDAAEDADRVTDYQSPARNELATEPNRERSGGFNPPPLATIHEFREWSERWVAASPEERKAMKAEGLRLARERRPVFKSMIVRDPQRALEFAVPRVVRQDLPAEIIAAMETPVSARGVFNVYRGRPQDGARTPADGELTLRYFETADASYHARVFGPLLAATSQKDVAVSGVALDRELAVAPSPVRPLEEGERIAPGTPVDETCPVSGITTSGSAASEPVTAATPAVEVEGRVIRLCNGTHVRLFEEDYTRGIQASGGPGGAQFIYDNYPNTTAEAIGNFRALYIRVAYPDHLRAPNTEASAYDDMRNVSRYFLESSFGRLSQTSVVTPLVVMPHTREWYIAKDSEVDGLGLVHGDARSEARRLGYDSAQFDVTIVRVNGGPRLSGVSWGGGDSVWVSWDGMDVINHEAGHSLGRGHANFWNTGGVSAIGDGANDEYGNSFDVMGGGSGFSAHYNSVSKRALGWLPGNSVHQPAPGVSGTYRIHAYDQPRLEEGKRYCVRVAKDNKRWYHIEYHDNYGVEHGSSLALRNSALVLWSWPDLGNAGHLIDTTPGTPGGKRDGGIELGRTFSDRESGLHFTVTGKFATVPPSLDVVLNAGAYPGNLPPGLNLTASTAAAGLNTAVTFTAAATDPNGDPLAYHWDCGDGYFSENTAVFTRAFGENRVYTIHCTVSDMKGGATRRHVVVTAGSTARRSVTGNVTAAGQPLQGVLISNGSDYAWTDASGNYSLPDMTVGNSYTLAASLYGYSFTTGFANPLTLTAGANVADWTAAGSVQVTIAAGTNAAEPATSGTFLITRTGGTAAALPVHVLSPGGTAARGTDYDFNPAYVDDGDYRTFTIPAGQATLTVNAGPTNDTAAEGPETIILHLAEGTGYVPATPASATILLNDNDTSLPLISLSSIDRDASEIPGDTAAFTLRRTGPTTAGLNVTVTYGGGAVRGTDYPPLATTVSIPAGQSSATVTLTPANDVLAEGTETATVTLGTGAGWLNDPTQTSVDLLILDDDTPVMTVTALDADAGEAGRDPGIFVLTRTGPVTQPLRVFYGVSGSALHGTDYLPLPAEITIPAGQSSGPVFITPVDDGHGEKTESVNLRLTAFDGTYIVGSQADATVNITDNNDPPLITVNATSTTCAEPADTGSFTFQSRGSNPGPVIVNYTLAGTAIAGGDYTALGGSVVIPAPDASGLSEVEITVTPVNDSVKEDMETIILTITPAAQYITYHDGSATLWLRDDDQPTLNVTRHSDTPEEDTPVDTSSFYIGRTDAAASAVTTGALPVGYTISGTASSGADYVALSGNVTIPDGAAGADVILTPINDALVEGAETVTITLNPSTNYGLGVSTATLTIVDDEAETGDSGVLSVRFVSAEGATTETPDATSGEYRLIPVELSAASANTVSAEYVVGGGTTALADGIDWNLADPATNALIHRGVISFAPGTTTGNIRIRVVNDGVIEGDETAVIELRNAVNARLSSSRDSHTLTISDNTAGHPLPRVTFLTATSLHDENVPSAPLLMAALDRPATGPVTVNFARTGGTAAPASDFTLTNGTLSFAAGETAKWIPLTIVNDAAVEAEETITLALSGPSGAALGPVTTHTLTIHDDDTPAVTLVVSDDTGWEPDNTAAFTVQRTGSGNGAATIAYTVSGTASSGGDFATLSGTITLPANQATAVITVTPVDNAAGESNETVVLTLTPGPGYNLEGTVSGTITILDDDIPPVVTITSPASPNAAIPPGVGLMLDGTVVKHAPGGSVPAAASWSKVSGPGTVTFGNPAAVATSAIFSVTGNYVLRLTGTSGGFTAAKELSVTTGVPLTTPTAVAIEIGTNDAPGGWSESAGAHTVSGSGTGLSGTGTSDGFFLFAAPRSGDFDLKVRVASLTNPGGDSSCRIGLIARAPAAPDAPYAMSCYRGDGTHGFNYRATAGAATANSQGTTNYVMPRWLRLVRSGNNFSAWHGTDGTAWTQRGSSQGLPNVGVAPLVGLAITSADELASTAVCDGLNFSLYPNIGPLVNAGPDLSGSNPFALDGTVTDDGLPLPAVLTTTWQKAGGPGTVIFGNLADIDTSATLAASGAHTLRLVAHDGGIATFDDTIVALTALPPMEQWRQAKFGADAGNPSIAGDLIDDDRDGLSNLAEYGLNLEPRSAFSAIAPFATRDGGTVSLTYRRNLAATDISMTVESSNDLIAWAAASVTETIVSDDGSTRVIRAEVPAAAGRQCLRVKIVH